MTRAAMLATLAVLVAVARPAHAQTQGHYQDFGDARGFLNIVPPGQDGVLNGPEAIAAQGGTYPPHVKDQLDMYANLVYNTPGLTEDRLLEFYKDASFGVRDDDIDRVYLAQSDEHMKYNDKTGFFEQRIKLRGDALGPVPIEVRSLNSKGAISTALVTVHVNLPPVLPLVSLRIHAEQRKLVLEVIGEKRDLQIIGEFSDGTVRIISPELRAPRRNSSESISSDLPAPVSPVRTFRPDPGSIVSSSTIARLRTLR